MSFYEHEHQMQAYCQKVKFTIIDKMDKNGKQIQDKNGLFFKDIIFEQLLANVTLICKDWMKFYYIINFEQIIFEEVL